MKFFKTPAEREVDAGRAALAKAYETEVLRPAAGGEVLLEEAERNFREGHKAVLLKLFGPTGEPAKDLDPFEIG
jgi:hypothetical protein